MRVSCGKSIHQAAQVCFIDFAVHRSRFSLKGQKRIPAGRVQGPWPKLSGPIGVMAQRALPQSGEIHNLTLERPSRFYPTGLRAHRDHPQSPPGVRALPIHVQDSYPYLLLPFTPTLGVLFSSISAVLLCNCLLCSPPLHGWTEWAGPALARPMWGPTTQGVWPK